MQMDAMQVLLYTVGFTDVEAYSDSQCSFTPLPGCAGSGACHFFKAYMSLKLGMQVCCALGSFWLLCVAG
jgi:hypothetical protein